MRLRTYFSPVYAPASVPSLARLGAAAETLERRGLIELCTAEPADAQTLAGLHDDAYLHAFLHGVEPMASSQGIGWSPELRDATLAMLGGQLQAAQYALRHGLAMNLARGFHHAVYQRGSGFCPINGLALVAYRMPHLRVFVVDCDEHGGNGTEEYTARLPNLYTASVFGTRFGCVGGERSWAFEVRVARDGIGAYQAALRKVDALLRAHRPDLILYQAGTDCHIHDPKSRVGLTTRRFVERDLFVGAAAQRLGIPLVVVAAGGYQRAADIAELNAATVRAMLHVHGRRAATPRAGKDSMRPA